MPHSRSPQIAQGRRSLSDLHGGHRALLGHAVGRGRVHHGESFVPRNVGIKSRFQNGRWGARICFMDHDGMRGLTAPGEVPQPAWPIEGMRRMATGFVKTARRRASSTVFAESTALRQPWRRAGKKYSASASPRCIRRHAQSHGTGRSGSPSIRPRISSYHASSRRSDTSVSGMPQRRVSAEALEKARRHPHARLHVFRKI